MIVRLPSRTGDRSRTPSGGYVRLFDPLGGTVVRLPWMPEEIETSNVAQAWSEVPRPGRVPLLLSSGKNLPVVSLPFRLVNPGQSGHVEGNDRGVGEVGAFVEPGASGCGAAVPRHVPDHGNCRSGRRRGMSPGR